MFVLKIIRKLFKIANKPSIFVAVLLFSTPSFAGQFSGAAKITGFYMPASGSFIRITVDIAAVNPSTCGAGDFYITELNSAAQDRFVSTVMSAFLSGKTVNFWIEGCTSGSYWGATRPVMTDVYIYP
jgi:hypothetical protein